MLLLPIILANGNESQLIYISEMYFPFVSQRYFFNEGYACRYTQIVGILKRDFNWLKEHDRTFRCYLEKGVLKYIEIMLFHRILCNNFKVEERLHCRVNVCI